MALCARRLEAAIGDLDFRTGRILRHPLVKMLMEPPVEFRPYRVPWGPFSTSMRSMSNRRAKIKLVSPTYTPFRCGATEVPATRWSAMPRREKPPPNMPVLLTRRPGTANCNSYIRVVPISSRYSPDTSLHAHGDVLQILLDLARGNDNPRFRKQIRRRIRSCFELARALKKRRRLPTCSTSMRIATPCRATSCP